VISLGLVGLLVAPLALIGLFFLAQPRTFNRHFFARKLRVGAPVIYQATETSTCPTNEAYDVHPAEHGDYYYYLTNKYWRVEEVRPDGWIVARSALMEHHYLRRDDPNLRKANFFERLRYGGRFPFPA
jgi:hypothetical protein